MRHSVSPPCFEGLSLLPALRRCASLLLGGTAEGLLARTGAQCCEARLIEASSIACFARLLLHLEDEMHQMLGRGGKMPARGEGRLWPSVAARDHWVRFLERSPAGSAVAIGAMSLADHVSPHCTHSSHLD